ncbi:hypothetical protein PUN28_011832 [Cardiocondyla obscurior]|uniref:THAP-type domain-containing protein n=1 Tax=Cardiocondyla obscurior TaxID=286306 RepID=A0AAW2FFP4_9HYME
MELYNNYRVCKLHFENKMFLNFEKTRLQPNAVPNFQIRNKKKKDLNKTNILSDHNLQIIEVDKFKEVTRVPHVEVQSNKSISTISIFIIFFFRNNNKLQQITINNNNK